MEPCKETEKSSEKGDTDSPLAKTEDKENKPGIHAVNAQIKQVQMVRYLLFFFFGSPLYRYLF